jgi:hypothetical protein
VTSDIRKRAADVAYKAVSSLEGAGVFAVELFLTGDGQVVFLLPSLRLLNVFFFFFLLHDSTMASFCIFKFSFSAICFD